MVKTKTKAKSKKKKKLAPRVYIDYSDYWRHGNHGFSSAGRDIVEAYWKDLEPTILANRTDWEELLIHECNQERENFIKYLRLFHDYLDEFKLEEVAGVKFCKWTLDQVRAGKVE